MLVLNIYQLSPGGRRCQAEHNGTSRWPKQSEQMFAAIKSRLHQLPGFHVAEFILCRCGAARLCPWRRPAFVHCCRGSGHLCGVDLEGSRAPSNVRRACNSRPFKGLAPSPAAWAVCRSLGAGGSESRRAGGGGCLSPHTGFQPPSSSLGTFTQQMVLFSSSQRR